jgi:hypothetical protein
MGRDRHGNDLLRSRCVSGGGGSVGVLFAQRFAHAQGVCCNE